MVDHQAQAAVMDLLPSTTNKLFAVVKDTVIVDIAWGIETNAKSVKFDKHYPNSTHRLIEVTESNSPMTLGQIYTGA